MIPLLTLVLAPALAFALPLQARPDAKPSSPAPASPDPKDDGKGAPVTPTPLPVPSPDQLLVVLRPKVEARHTPVRLQDVADLLGPAEEIARFARLELCPAPVAGKPRLVTPAGVRLAARLAGLDLDKERIVGATQAEIVANWLELGPDELAATAQQWLLAQGAELGDKVLIEVVVKPDAVALLKGGGDASYQHVFVGRPRGATQVQVKQSVFQDGTLLGERVATFRVRRFGKQLRLLTNARRGELVTAAQVVLMDGEWTTVTGTPLIEAEAFRGLVAARDLPAGTVLVRESFEQPLLVDRGGSVRVVLRDGALQIVATGVAQRAGRRGETIPVLNPSTQRVMQAQLVEKRSSGEVVALAR